MTGEALQKLVGSVSNLTPDMLAKVRHAYVPGIRFGRGLLRAWHP